MPDWRDEDLFPEEEGHERAPGDGVRVVGDHEQDPQPPQRPQRPQAPQPEARFPLPEGPSWSASGGDYEADEHEQPAAGGVQLPHWTEPATGEVPRVLGGEHADDDFAAWSQAGATGSGPRYRTGDADWAESDWAEGELFKDETMGVASHGDDDWPAPPRRRGRRGRGAPAEEQERHEGPGGLEGHPPGDHEEYDEPDGPPDLAPRVITAAVMAAVALAAFAIGRGAAMVLVTVIVAVSAFELYAAFQRSGYQPATLIGLLGSLAMVPVAYEYGERGLLVIIILVVVFTFLWYLIEVVHARPTINIGLTLLPFGWVGIFGAFAGLLLSPPVDGTGLLMGVIICAVGSDVVSFFAGRSIGRTPLLPRISPHKTVEGFLAGALTAVVLGAVVGSLLHPWADHGLGAGLMLGILVAVTAPLGDLVESMIKRDLGVKDIGGFLPGHGGFLDRFDAILFTLPVAWYWAFHLFTT
jgi:phosphatidate cytidylyltransferase